MEDGGFRYKVYSLADLMEILWRHGLPLRVIVDPEAFRKIWSCVSPAERCLPQALDALPHIVLLGCLVEPSVWPARADTLDLTGRLNWEYKR